MTLEAASTRLVRACDSVIRVVRDLSWSVTDAAPEGASHALQHRYEEAVGDVLALALELGASARRTASAAESIDYRASRRALVEAQSRFNALTYQFEQELGSHDGLEELYELEATGPEAWQSWARGVRDAVAGCSKPLYHTRELLFECWQDLTEGIGVFTTSPGHYNHGRGDPGSPDPTRAGPVRTHENS